MKYLIVVDMQNDFIDGALGTPDAVEIVPKVVEKIESFDGVVLATLDTHDDNYLDTQEGKNLPVPHCIKGTAGWSLHESVAQSLTKIHGMNLESTLFEKITFGSAELAYNLYSVADRKENIDEIVLVGLCTDICVISNAMLIKAYLPEVKITVDAACCAGVTPESHANALKAMKMCQINIENWEG